MFKIAIPRPSDEPPLITNTRSDTATYKFLFRLKMVTLGCCCKWKHWCKIRHTYWWWWWWWLMCTWRFFVIDAEGDYQTDEWRNTTSTTSFTNEYYTVLFTAQHYRHESTVSRQSVWWTYNRMQLLYSSPVLSDQLMMRAITAKADTTAAPATNPALGGLYCYTGSAKNVNPSGKILYFWNYSSYIHYRWGFISHILQILLK